MVDLGENNGRPDNQLLFTSILKSAGVDLTVVGNGHEAIEQALAVQDGVRPFDVILMDMRMPIMDGYQATRKLRRCRCLKPLRKAARKEDFKPLAQAALSGARP